MPISLQNSPARRLFTDAQWQRITQSPTHLDAQTWSSFTNEQRHAVQDLQAQLKRDAFGGAPTAAGKATFDALQGGASGTHWAGKGDPIAIHTIQGTGNASPYAGQVVPTSGIVTAVDDRGFFVQEPKQGYEQGSPGIYVFVGGTPNVKPGDDVTLSGKVVEFQRQKDAVDFPGATVTQIATRSDAITVRSSGNPLPAAFIIGKGGIALSHTASNEALWEKLEGARVRINDAVVVGAPNDIPRYSDLQVVPDNAEGAGKRTIAGGLIRDAAANPYTLSVRMPVERLPAVNVGSRFPEGLEGVVVERHGHHQVQVDAPTALVPSTFKPETTTLREKFPDPEHVLFIASLNGENKDVKVEDITKVQDQDVRNVDDDVGSGKLEAMARQIIKNLASPDIVAMQEIQDNDGAELSAVTDASATWHAIIEKIVELGGPRYAYVDRDPVNGKEGGMPGGNIRNGFLYNPKRVELEASSVKRMEDPAFEGSRVPLIATFVFKHGGETERVTLTSVHNKSKRSGGAVSEDMRQAQSAAINAWAKANAPKNDHEHLGAFGDRNAYDDEEPLKIETRDGALKELSGEVAENRRYSTEFGGSSASLDHDTVKTSVPVTLDIVHMNSDFDARFRASDHDGTLTAWDFRRGKA